MQRSWKRLSSGHYRAVGLLVLAVGCVPVAVAGDDAESPPPAVSLDKLLTLPSSLEVETQQRRGVTRSEWQNRFAEAEAERSAAQEALAASLEKLQDLAAEKSAWNVSAPGSKLSTDNNAPLDYGLKQEIRRRREDVERTERQLRELVVEANLAGVPEDWQDGD